VKRSLIAIITAFTLLLIVPAVAGATGDETLSPEALAIANSLNCPVCQGESVRDSNSQLSHDIRQLIQQKLDQGESRQQIMDYFVSRYGETILRQPPKNGFSLALWWIPVGAIVFGLLVLAGFLTQKRRLTLAPAGEVTMTANSDSDLDLALFEERVKDDVARFEEDLLGSIDLSRVDAEAPKTQIEDVGKRGLAGSDQAIS
jgi:cytochrome c-type biogenesis protein CcmH